MNTGKKRQLRSEAALLLNLNETSLKSSSQVAKGKKTARRQKLVTDAADIQKLSPFRRSPCQTLAATARLNNARCYSETIFVHVDQLF